jgi:hypothetical protein
LTASSDQGFDRARFTTVVEDLCIRQPGSLESVHRLQDHHDRLGIAVRERPEQNGIEDNIAAVAPMPSARVTTDAKPGRRLNRRPP